MHVRLDGRTALITGGSKGLGLATAIRFAEAGAEVAILARNAETLETAKALIGRVSQARLAAFPCDVTDPASIKRGYDGVMSAFGKVDILINNAGTSQTGQFEDITDAIWQADLDLKLFAAIRLARLVLPQMKARRWGRIINVLATAAKAPRAASAPTSVSRAAGMALTKVLASECASDNVLVNALLVGRIVSDQIARRHRAEGTNAPLAAYIREHGKGIPIGRMGEAEEFANLACFLASEAGSYVTGTAINVDGGLSPVV